MANKYIWLPEDGILDLQAAYIAASSHRTPRLTYREALLAVFLLMKSGHRNADIEKILDKSRSCVSDMVIKIRKNPDEYESLLSQASAPLS